MPEPTTDGPAEYGNIAEALAYSYGMEVTEAARLPTGQGTVNYRVACGGRQYFVKHYPNGTDLDAEAQAIALTGLVARHGIPAPGLFPAYGDRKIARHGSTAVSVWEWIDGHTVTDGFTPAQQEAAGETLGRIHSLFASRPESARPSAELDTWLTPDLVGLEATIDKLLALIAERTEHDDFDRAAEQTLAERRQALTRVPAILSGLPRLSTQVLHGDYSAVNLLWDGDILRAVTDFRPPEPFLNAYELGRIAFDPRTVVLDDNWIECSTRLVRSYLSTNPHAHIDDARSCGRVALLQLLTSLYGVKQHYLKPGLIQSDLDAFWLLRHRACLRLLERLDEVEAALEAATRLPGTNIRK